MGCDPKKGCKTPLEYFKDDLKSLQKISKRNQKVPLGGRGTSFPSFCIPFELATTPLNRALDWFFNYLLPPQHCPSHHEGDGNDK